MLPVPSLARGRGFFDLSREAHPGPQPSSHPAHRFAVLRQPAIGGEQTQAFTLSLDHQQAIKRIAVNPGQIPHRQHMLGLNGQLLEPLPQQSPAQGWRVHLEILPTEGGFDRQFPEARQAVANVVVPIH